MIHFGIGSVQTRPITAHAVAQSLKFGFGLPLTQFVVCFDTSCGNNTTQARFPPPPGVDNVPLAVESQFN
jgi:hypothetical protein